jgi:hypothetical protein
MYILNILNMSNFGVNIEDVWHQGSLLPPQQVAPKRSKYTVPFDDNRRNGSNNSNNSNNRSNSGDNYAVDRNGVWSEKNTTQDHVPVSIAADIPISIPQQPIQSAQQYLVETMNNQINNTPVQSSQSSQPSQPSQPQDSDVVKNYMIQYQQEIQYLRSMLQHMKKELHESQERNQHLQKRKKTELIWGFILLVIFLIIVVVLLSQIMMKLNRIIAQPLMFNV